MGEGETLLLWALICCQPAVWRVKPYPQQGCPCVTSPTYWHCTEMMLLCQRICPQTRASSHDVPDVMSLLLPERSFPLLLILWFLHPYGNHIMTGHTCHKSRIVARPLFKILEVVHRLNKVENFWSWVPMPQICMFLIWFVYSMEQYKEISEGGSPLVCRSDNYIQGLPSGNNRNLGLMRMKLGSSPILTLFSLYTVHQLMVHSFILFIF